MESNHNSSNRRLISVSIKVEIHPGITILKAQKKLLDVCGGDAKKIHLFHYGDVWSREVLASHSMTRKCSNAHKEKEPKPCLDATKISALCGKLKVHHFVTKLLEIHTVYCDSSQSTCA